jgi:hypothetical protein
MSYKHTSKGSWGGGIRGGGIGVSEYPHIEYAHVMELLELCCYVNSLNKKYVQGKRRGYRGIGVSEYPHIRISNMHIAWSCAVMLTV